jgi:hypothetical protein
MKRTLLVISILLVLASLTFADYVNISKWDKLTRVDPYSVILFTKDNQPLCSVRIREPVISSKSQISFTTLDFIGPFITQMVVDGKAYDIVEVTGLKGD